MHRCLCYHFTIEILWNCRGQKDKVCYSAGNNHLKILRYYALLCKNICDFFFRSTGDFGKFRHKLIGPPRNLEIASMDLHPIDHMSILALVLHRGTATRPICLILRSARRKRTQNYFHSYICAHPLFTHFATCVFFSRETYTLCELHYSLHPDCLSISCFPELPSLGITSVINYIQYHAYYLYYIHWSVVFNFLGSISSLFCFLCKPFWNSSQPPVFF